MSEPALYKLEPITDNPKFEGFGFVREQSIRGKAIGGQSRLVWDFGPDDVKTKGREWTVTALTPFWTPQQVAGRVRPFNDYPCVNLTIPAFSQRAVDALRDFLESNGELLPLVSAVGEYFAYNVTKVADVLDEAQSQIRWLSDRHTFDQIFEIDRYECFAEKMASLSIFRLVEMSSRTFVTQAFVDRVRKHELHGFHFVKLWPLPEGVSWQEEDRKERKKKVQVPTKQGSTLVKGNTVVLLLPIAKAKPSKAEKERLAKVMDDIDALLYDPAGKPNAPHLGNLEGDDHHDGQIRVFLSCPNADTLVEKLRPWLKTLSWDGPVKALKRYGAITDLNCREEYVEV